jgi:two-component system response regulator MprA
MRAAAAMSGRTSAGVAAVEAASEKTGGGTGAERPLLLVVDDERAIVDFITLGMRYEGFRIAEAPDGQTGLALSVSERPDVVILDIMLPDLDGLQVCRRLRAHPLTANVPILMLTAKDEIRDRVVGLEAGADDYLTKPFSFEELLARVRALLRRQQRTLAAGGAGARTLRVADIVLDEAAREVRRGERVIELTATEYSLLHLFITHPRQVLDRQTILNRVWGYDFMGDTNIIEVYVRYLREKIEDEPSNPRLIQTVRGVGYVLKG